jgi:hypothetical protein
VVEKHASLFLRVRTTLQTGCPEGGALGGALLGNCRNYLYPAARNKPLPRKVVFDGSYVVAPVVAAAHAAGAHVQLAHHNVPSDGVTHVHRLTKVEPTQSHVLTFEVFATPPLAAPTV